MHLFERTRTFIRRVFGGAANAHGTPTAPTPKATQAPAPVASGTAASFLDDPENQRLLDRLWALKQSNAPKAIFDQAFSEYSLRNSTPISPADFAPHAEAANRLLEALESRAIQVYKTTPQFLYHYGMSPMSQLGKCFCREHGAHIFLDKVGPNLNPLELLDTLAHEASHATGPLLNRWAWVDQPDQEQRQAYAQEEAVAVLGACRIMEALRLPAYEPTRRIRMALDSLGAPRPSVATKDAERKALEIEDFLLGPRAPSATATATGPSMVPGGIVRGSVANYMNQKARRAK